eukprot:3119740-Pyramimonas_sp.AAC.1
MLCAPPSLKRPRQEAGRLRGQRLEEDQQCKKQKNRSVQRPARISWICAGPHLEAPPAPPLARSALRGVGSGAEPRSPRGPSE